ncbi:MAG: primary-amine oxidase [Acetobacteraceae bacterium]|nr:primary-amine oxidase [Acetobacteraceae bacterium]
MDDLRHEVASAAQAIARPVTHPLQPLTAAEIRTVIGIIHVKYSGSIFFETIELLEPAKSLLAEWRPGQAIPRAARANVFRAEENGVWQLTVSIDNFSILTERFVAGARAMIQAEQFVAIEQAVVNHPDFIEACRKRGLTDMSLVCVDPWTAGTWGFPDEEGSHIAHTFCWLRTRPFDNLYAHPIEGLNGVVDVKTCTLIRIDDHSNNIPIPTGEVNYEARFRDTFRAPMKPLDVVQPEGPSFTLNGHELSWDRWSLVVGFNAREGITLHQIAYDGRPVVHRASLVEMVVPYGSPHNGHYRKNVFDIGEYGIGKLANSLKLGCDCLGHIAYLDAELNTMNGGVVVIENAICIHEEDNGVLWKHWDFRTEHTEVRRGRKLVISSISTVGNYEYGSYWYLKQDGTIEFEMKATGIINTVACLPGQPSKYGTEVSPGVEGQIHQHAFCARLDMAIDGNLNSVVECNTYTEEDENNPYGNAFYMQETLLDTEQAGCRRANPATQRYWKVINPNKLNQIGRPIGYKLEPAHLLTQFVKPDSPSGARASFMRNHLWVTAYDPDERYPGGEFMNHSTGAGGLTEMIATDRPIANADIVLWHVFGLHHVPRPEDFPVQPVITCGFKLMPAGFFDANPAIDLPPEVNHASKRAVHVCCA